MKFVVFLVFIVAALGCSSTWVQKDYQRKMGVIKFLDEGANFVVENRRSDARSKMGQFCNNNKFEVLEEATQGHYMGSWTNSNLQTSTSAQINGAQSSNTITGYAQTTSTGASTSFPMVSNYTYLIFKCLWGAI